jgi:hypothetical protein
MLDLLDKLYLLNNSIASLQYKEGRREGLTILGFARVIIVFFVGDVAQLTCDGTDLTLPQVPITPFLS